MVKQNGATKESSDSGSYYLFFGIFLIDVFTVFFVPLGFSQPFFP